MPRLAPYRVTKGGYSPRSVRYPCAGIRPTRAAAGMTFTASRGGGTGGFADASAPAYMLRAFGTCDALRHGLRNGFRAVLATRKPCPCCGGPGKLALTDKGRTKLAVLRARREERGHALAQILAALDA